MSFRGMFADESLDPSYCLGMVKEVHIDTHSVNVQPYSTLNSFDFVPVFNSPGSFSLPNIGDVVALFFDNRGKPIVIGIAPKFYKDRISNSELYQLQPGDRGLITELGNKLLLLDSIGSIKLSTLSDYGFEVSEKGGYFLIQAPVLKEQYYGVFEKKGYVRRTNYLSINSQSFILQHENTQQILKKVGGLDVAGTLSTSTGLDLNEKIIEIKIPGSETVLNPEGLNLYKETLGATVVKLSGTTYVEDLHTDTSLPIRKKTVLYDSTGLIELVKEETDAKGNIHLYISPLATTGVNINAAVPFIMQLLKLEITTTGKIALTSGAETTLNANSLETTTTSTTKLNASQIELNGNTDFVALANLLVSAFNSHIHSVPGITSGPSSTVSAVPTTPWSAGTVGSTTVKAS